MSIDYGDTFEMLRELKARFHWGHSPGPLCHEFSSGN